MSSHIFGKWRKRCLDDSEKSHRFDTLYRKIILTNRTLEFAHIAQLVEHFLGKEEVTGSNPVMG